MAYVIYRKETTEARHAIDGKKHTHKYYLYPVPSVAAGLGIGSCWGYKNGKRGAVKFTSKAEAARIAKKHGATIEEV